MNKKSPQISKKGTKTLGHTVGLHHQSQILAPTRASTAELWCVIFFGHVLARRKALCPWLGVGLRVNWEGTMLLLILSNAKFIGHHLQGGGAWAVARPKKGF